MLTNVLPIGVMQGEKTLREFTLNKLSVRQIKEINDEQYRAQHPLKWLGRTATSILSTIDGVPVSSNGEGKKNYIDELVRKMTIPDISYILLAGHVHSLGGEIEDYRTTCFCPTQAEVAFNIDLSAVELPDTSELAYDMEMEAELEDGLDLSREKMAVEMGIADRKWTRYFIRIPRLDDFLRNELHFSTSAKSSFTERVLASAITRIQDENGEDMPTALVQLLKEKLVLNLSGRDMTLLNRATKQLVPAMRLTAPTECSRCGKEIDMPVEPSFLFSMA